MPKVISIAGEPTGEEASTSASTSTNTVLVLISPKESNMAQLLHNILPNTTVKVISTWKYPSLHALCSSFNKIVTTRKDILCKILGDSSASPFTYAGSIIPYMGAKFLILDGLYQLPYKAEYNVLSRQYCRKLIAPEIFPQVSFKPHIYHRNSLKSIGQARARLMHLAEASTLISIDVETRPFIEFPEGVMPEGAPNLMHNILDVVGFGFLSATGEIESHSIQIDTMEAWEVARDLCATPAPKVTHGKYDTTWCLRWGMPIYNATFDTMQEMHTWYHDFRKSLAHVAAFTCKDYVYWKEERKETDIEKKLLYNAKDVHYTTCALMYFMQHSPKWTRTCTRRKAKRLMYTTRTGILGFNTDEQERQKLLRKYTEKADKLLEELRVITGSPEYNPNSPPQSKQLLTILALNRVSVTGSDQKQMDAVKELDTFSLLIMQKLEDYKKTLKVINSYLNARLWDGRLLTSVDVTGTTSDRWASKLADFWHSPDVGKSGKYLKPKSYGVAIMTVKHEARSFVVADEGMTLFSCDLPSSEAYFVEKLCGDPTLKKVLYSGKDYHCINASLFFGVPYDAIYDDIKGVVINKELRTLAKRVNHGSNYNMGASVLLDTMGLQNILRAQELLCLNPDMKPIDIAAHLLNLFKDTYPYIKGGEGVMLADSWYGKLTQEVYDTGSITCPDGFRKYVFGDPKNKLVMNNLASIKPQHLSAEYLHQGMEDLIENHGKIGELEVLCPIHDELFGQVKKGMEEHYSPIIREAMTLSFDVGTSILRLEPDAPVFGNHWTDVH